jgi:hypothetical protein
VYKFEVEDKVAFEVSKMQHPDLFGKDYTVYCMIKEEDKRYYSSSKLLKS